MGYEKITIPAEGEKITMTDGVLQVPANVIFI